MNPEPLSSYKEKTYNPGSPCPSPSRDPFSDFPLAKPSKLKKPGFSSATKPDNPLKLVISTKRKRLEKELHPEKNLQLKKQKWMNSLFPW